MQQSSKTKIRSVSRSFGELERLDWNLNRDETEGSALQQNYVARRIPKYLEQALLKLFNLVF